MSSGVLKLSTYFGEHDRAGGTLLADALAALYGRHEVHTSVVLRGALGFGAAQRLRTDRLLSLSEDLPVVSIAVDAPERIEPLAEEVVRLCGDGLITLERARSAPAATGAPELPAGSEASKLTVYVGRGERTADAPAHVAIVDVLHRSGVAGASVLLGVDGTVGGTRRRARTVGANARVPAMIVAVGDEESITAALPEIAALEPSREGVAPLITLERVRVCKRDGVPLTDPQDLPATDAAGLGVWQKLTVYSGEQSRHRGRPLHDELVGALRGAGAAGATVLRGVWGYHGDHHPHGDHLLQLRRRVPVVTTIVDAPERARRWFAVVDEVTDETGLVTSEVVPALRVAAGGTTTGGLRLARPRGGPAAAGPP